MTDQGTNFEDLWDDREAVRKIPPVYCNRMFVEPMGDGMLRVNFGLVNAEGYSDYTASIVVSAHNAVAFADLIARWGASLLPTVPIPTPAAPPAE